MESTFLAALREILIPTLKKHGLSTVRCESESLTMESRHLRLTVSRDRRDCVVDVSFGGANGRFDLADLLIAAGVANPGMACSDDSLLRDRLNWLSNFLHTHYGYCCGGTRQHLSDCRRWPGSGIENTTGDFSSHPLLRKRMKHLAPMTTRRSSAYSLRYGLNWTRLPQRSLG
jgi:hypothetical protein